MVRTYQANVMNLIVVLCIASLLNACTSMRTVSNPVQTSQSEVGVGDEIEVITSNQGAQILTVTAVTDASLTGISCDDCTPVTIAMADIETLKVRKISALKTGASGVGIFVGIVLGALLLGGGAGLLPPGL